MIAMDSYLVAAVGLGDLCAIREATLRGMTADLLETGNWRVRGDAIRQLHADGYKTGDVLLLADQAIYVCAQEAVARAMSDEDVNHLAAADAAMSSGHPGTVG